MRSIWHRSWALVVSVILTLSQTATGADEKVLKEVQSAESDFERFTGAHDGPISPILDAWTKLMNLEKKLVVLQVGDRTYWPQAVYKARLPRNGWDFTGLTADDTIHTTESQAYVPIKCKPGEIFKATIAWNMDSLSRCDFYIGDPRQMHAHGYKQVVKLAFTDDTVQLPGCLEHRDYLLLAMIKAKDADYRKFVFVVHPEGKRN